MKALLFVLFSVAMYGQREEVTLSISIDGPTRTLLNKKRATIAHPSSPARTVLANITATDVTIRVGDGELPAVPFQAAIGVSDALEIVRVTAATRQAPVIPQSSTPATYQLTVERGRATTVARDVRAGEVFVPLKYDTITRMLKQEVLVKWILESHEQALRMANDAAVAQAVAAAQRDAVQ